jgi:FAD/FMN-containing dehydrogenase
VERITNIADAIKKSKQNKNDWHAYQNYVDPYLGNFGTAYYGSNLDRLKAVKRLADPDNIFDHPQGLDHA